MESERTRVVTVRMPQSLHERLKRICQATGYSMNAVAVAAIELECGKLELSRQEKALEWGRKFEPAAIRSDANLEDGK